MGARVAWWAKTVLVIGTIVVVLCILLGHTAGLAIAAVFLAGLIVGRVLLALGRPHRAAP